MMQYIIIAYVIFLCLASIIFRKSISTLFTSILNLWSLWVVTVVVLNYLELTTNSLVYSSIQFATLTVVVLVLLSPFNFRRLFLDTGK